MLYSETHYMQTHRGLVTLALSAVLLVLLSSPSVSRLISPVGKVTEDCLDRKSKGTKSLSQYNPPPLAPILELYSCCMALKGETLCVATTFASGGNCVLSVIVYTGCTPFCTLLLLYVRQTCSAKLWIPELPTFPLKYTSKWVRWKLIGKLHFHMHCAML